jgi:cytochrome c
VIQLTSDKKGGSVPFKASFSSAGTKDADNDVLKYVWKVTAQNGGNTRTFNEANPTVAFDKPGIYKATLTVTDSKGDSSSQTLEIMADNEEPVLTFETPSSNQTFFFPNQPFEYEVKVTDKEDGSLENGKIKPEEVAISFDYLPEGFDMVAIAQGHRSADAAAGTTKGLQLIESSDCNACHSMDKKSIGPSYTEIATKYKNDSKAAGLLASKVISGGSGVWGPVAMSAHPQLAEADALEMVNYILSLSQEKQATVSLPVKGSYNMAIPEGDKGEGIYVVRAAYKDKGSNGIPPITAEKMLTLRNAKMPAGKADKTEGIMKYGNIVIASVKESSIGFKNIDLTGIDKIAFTATAPKSQLNAAGGFIEVRLGSPTGKLVGKTEMIEPKDPASQTGMPPAVVANLTKTSGTHDVYFVFKNDKVDGGQALFVVIDLEFQNSQSVASTSVYPTAGPQKKLAAGELLSYTGKYKMTGLPFEYIEVSTNGDKLHINAGGNEGDLSPGPEDDVFSGDNDAIIKFGRNADKKVTTIILKAQGFTFEGTKE